MMMLFSLLLLFVQLPAAQTVIVGLVDGQKLVVENPQFSGFLEGRAGGAVLMYRQEHFHGELPASALSRIEFGEYKKGKPFAMTITLRNGSKLEALSDRRDFISLKGATEFGTVIVHHPDPLSVPLRLTTRKPDRKNDLTIQYLEFPAS